MEVEKGDRGEFRQGPTGDDSLNTGSALKKRDSKLAQNTPFLGPDSEINSNSASSRSKTSLRLRYEAEVQVIQKQWGSLDEIRESLGLSQRKMAQLLMVDPSAWTRWVKRGETAPPHIYRALQWYLHLQGKQPGHGPASYLGRDLVRLSEKDEARIAEEQKERKALERRLEDTLRDSLGAVQEELRLQRKRHRFVVGLWAATLALLVLSWLG